MTLLIFAIMKLCPNCTTNNPDDAETCSRCQYVFPKPKRTYDYPSDHIVKLEDHEPSAMAWFALAMGGVAVLSVFLIPVCSPLPGLLAVWLSQRENKRLNKRYSTKGERYVKMALWGGWVSMSIGILMLALGVTVSVWFVQWFRDVFRY
jgi:ribosomal protein L40E